MGRPLAGTAPRDASLPLRLTRSGLAAVDEARGDWSRSEYVRQALALAHKNGLRGPRK